MSKVYRKLTVFGGKGGQVWDDDTYEGIRKVYVGQDDKRITYVKFEYVKEDDEVVTREYGKVNQQPIEFVVEYPEENIIAVEGNYKTVGWLDTDVITNLLFKTSKGRQSLVFGPNVTSGTNFLIEDGGKKIVGFHGRSGNAIDAFGAYFVHDPLPPVYKLDAQGGKGGSVWDDGFYDNVKSLSVCQDDCRITYLEIEYEKAGKLETRHHGKKGKTPLKFELNPDEYIKSVEVTYDFPEVFGRDNTVITSLKFETSKGRKSEIYGYENSIKSKKFVLEQKGGKIIGFHGAEGSSIDALGAYFTPVQTPKPLDPSKKLAQVGGNGGDFWDDGVYDDVRKILVGQRQDGVAFVKFEYSKGKDLVSGDDHGKNTVLGAEEFVLEDGEYLMSIDVSYDTIYGIEAPLITSLKFKTNKKESTQFGIDAGKKETLEEKDHKIVGFHGQAGDYVHSIGVSVVPITTTE